MLISVPQQRITGYFDLAGSYSSFNNIVKFFQNIYDKGQQILCWLSQLFFTFYDANRARVFEQAYPRAWETRYYKLLDLEIDKMRKIIVLS